MALHAIKLYAMREDIVWYVPYVPPYITFWASVEITSNFEDSNTNLAEYHRKIRQAAENFRLSELDNGIINSMYSKTKVADAA